LGKGAHHATLKWFWRSLEVADEVCTQRGLSVVLRLRVGQGYQNWDHERTPFGMAHQGMVYDSVTDG
jgi:hypothetical protein